MDAMRRKTTALVTGAASVLLLFTLGCGGSAAEVAGSEDIAVADETVATENALSGSFAAGTKLKTTTGLNLRAGAGVSYRIILAMPAGATVTLVRSAPVGGWYEVTYGGARGWASGSYLVRASTSGGFVPGGKKVNIVGPAVRPHVQGYANSACAAVGCPLTVGTRVGHSPTADRALDLMQSYAVWPADGGARGDRLASYTLNNFSKHKVDYVIWKQRINLGNGRGWTFMADRGSITQNHYDHVHVSFKP